MLQKVYRELTGSSGKQKTVFLVAVLVLVAVTFGIFALHLHASVTTTSSFEPEDGNLANNIIKLSDSSASGGSAVQFGAQNNSALPFTLASQSELKGSPKKVFAHYFTPYPLQLDNVDSSTDYYSRNYLNPNGEGGAHLETGGLLRERPLPQPVSQSSGWKLDNMKREVERATDAGLDGFTVDILSLSGHNWDRLNLLMEAAADVDPDFKIVLMPDGTASATNSQSTLASAVAGLASESSAYHLSDGRLVVSPFAPEKQGAAWWQQWLNTMQSQYGISIAFVPCFLNYGANVDAFAPFSYGFSNWGVRTPARTNNLASNVQDAHNRGKIWMQAVAVQDERPNQKLYWEADNIETFRLTWAAAIDNSAEWVQIPTWNDYSEGAELSPSSHIGWSPLDINAYYLTKYKTGSYPTINKDVIYVSNRVQMAAALPNGSVSGYTKYMTLWPGSSPSSDKIEIMTFLTDSTTIDVTIGVNNYSYTAPAGRSVKTYPLAVGTITVSGKRGANTVASVTSPYPVKNDFAVQDMQYYFVSSARSGGIGSWDD